MNTEIARSEKARISIVVPDMGGAILGAATMLAHTLESHYTVEVVGPDFGQGISPMYQHAFPYTVVPAPHMYRIPEFFRDVRRLEKAITGDLVIAVKAYANTVPVALRVRKRRAAKVLVYLDEWDGAVVESMSTRERLGSCCRNWYMPLSDIYFPWVERLLSRADTVVSTSSSLQKKFGGHIIRMGVDTDFFKPAEHSVVQKLKASCDLTNNKLIVFGGVVRPHKGIELILDALVELGNPSFKFVIVGPVNEHVRALQAKPAYAPYVVALGAHPKAEMPTYLSLADLFVLPLNDTPLAQSQTPCKIFEAMAMARPIIASAVSDLPEILQDCGCLVPPGDSKALAAAISDLLDHPEKAEQMGHAARAQCVSQYNRNVTDKALLSVVNKLLS